MEGQLQSSPKLGSPTENDDVKYVSGLSTVLVATIQEAKDRIAQIEYIFCNQLYPNFKSKSKLLRKIYSEAKRASDGEWKERFEKLELEKQKALEELARIEGREKTRVDELESDLRKKSKEVDEGLKLHGDLVQLLEMKISAIVEKDKQLRENEEWKNVLESKVKALQEAIRAKAEEVVKGNELTGNLLKKIESRDSEIANCENVRRSLTEKLERSEETVRQLRSLQKADCSEESERVKKALLYQKTLEEIESKNAELRAEKRKRKEVIDAFKSLKSQYNFLCSQYGLSKENMISPLKSQEDSDLLTNNQIQITSPDLEERDQDTSPASCDKSKPKSKTIVSKTLNNEKQGQALTLAGTKRLATSFWRGTRTHQGKNGQDPHDDFLDTPLENVRGNIARAAAREDPRVSDASDDDDETQDVSDDRTQIKMKKKNPVVVAAVKEGGERGFKYVETVRKKAERENLKGVECKQCKKFYDAILCGEEGRDGNYAARCEHHEGVSRHRYKYVPPSTPEGFWNIGFESEM